MEMARDWPIVTMDDY